MDGDEARHRAARNWNRTVGPFYSRATLLRDLAIAEAELDARIERAEVLRLERGGREFFPAFQFLGDRSTVPGLRQLRVALNPALDPDVDWSVTLWLCVRRDEFDGANAVELLRGGAFDRVAEEAQRNPVLPPGVGGI
ncbi:MULTISPECIES: hypothetical protein [Agromyces]|uniref:hypothetical protein n=1 Tax=Agromyces TaxID=33877 RepID=UPI002040A625|nr:MULTISPECIES: hypothetical protein [Agromyces]MCM3658209.1 hypothetical protein [Agromyces mediolanus]GLU88065.1 hypothetical protein Agsp01_03200 [Agromyces sp. NBRC 114283]